MIKCSEKLEVILGLSEVILESLKPKSFTRDELKLLSELSVLLGILRNVSTVSFENRKIISNSKIFKNLSYFIYIRLVNEDNIGLFNIISYEILKVLDSSPTENISYNSEHLKEFLLLTSRFLQALANISVDSNVEYQVSN